MAGVLVAMVFDDVDGNPHWEVGSLVAKGKRPRRGTAWMVEFTNDNDMHDLPDEACYGAEWVFVKEVAPPVAAPAGPPAPASPPAGLPAPAPAPAPPRAPPSVPPSAAPPAEPAPPSALDWADSLTIIHPLGNLSGTKVFSTRVQHIEAEPSAAPPPAPPPPQAAAPSEQAVAAIPAAAPPPAVPAPPAVASASGDPMHDAIEGNTLAEAAAALIEEAEALEEAALEEEEEEEKFYSPTREREMAAAAELAEVARVARAQKTAVNPLLVMALGNYYISNDHSTNDHY